MSVNLVDGITNYQCFVTAHPVPRDVMSNNTKSDIGQQGAAAFPTVDIGYVNFWKRGVEITRLEDLCIVISFWRCNVASWSRLRWPCRGDQCSTP
jgi:hypothetical protein